MKTIIRLSPTYRLSSGLVLLSIGVVLIAALVGVLPDQRRSIVAGRSALCESIAITAPYLVSSGDTGAVQAFLQETVDRNPDILSAGYRRPDGRLLAEAGDHAASWENLSTESTTTEFIVPVTSQYSRQDERCNVEVRFHSVVDRGIWSWVLHPFSKLVLFLTPAGLLLFSLYLRKKHRHLDPSKAAPDPVKKTLDTLTEGLILVDRDGKIAHANQFFLDTVGSTKDDLVGTPAGQLAWETEGDKGLEEYPWTAAIRSGSRQTGDILVLKGKNSSRTFRVNASPVLGEDGEHRGALVHFDDVTLTHREQLDLRRMLNDLVRSRAEIHEQNRQLTLLAALDPLTSCLNRRSFFEQYERHWTNATVEGHALCCVMLDIDHFKEVNDTHGHSVGDEVLSSVSATLRHVSRSDDLVCRFGGEEFCILLPDVQRHLAARIAERYRSSVEQLEFESVKVTVSVGFSSSRFGAKDPQELIDQADKALYNAKRSGRNRVSCWDELSEIGQAVWENEMPRTDAPSSEPMVLRSPLRTTQDLPEGDSIPFQAVIALVSALGYRDAATAEHSHRVAELCVITANGLLSVRDIYVLEVAALLHDIGKIGVPDSVLLKPGPLTDDEWKIMGLHDRIGNEIVELAFVSSQLSSIVRSHYAWYGGHPRHAELPTGDDIPFGARLLAICDAYDAMISNRVYQKGMSQDEALAELRRCSDQQFDPYLVEHFVRIISSRKQGGTRLRELSDTTALSFGTQIEWLAEAIEQQNVTSLAALAGRLNRTALRHGVTKIADAAETLEAAASTVCDMSTLVNLTTELLELCRSVQRTHIQEWDQEKIDEQP